MVVILDLWFVHDGGDGGKVNWRLGLATFTGGSDWQRLLAARTGGVWIVGSDWRLGLVDLDWRLKRVDWCDRG
jgi:hypothetical protein